MDGIDSVEVAISVATKLLSKLREPIWVGREELCVTASIGIVLHSECPGDAGTLERYADLAMYNAKADGDTYHVHEFGGGVVGV